MEAFLITIILSLVFVIVFVVGIFRLFFRIGSGYGHYHHPPVLPGAYNRPERSSNFVGPLFIGSILIIGIFYFSTYGMQIPESKEKVIYPFQDKTSQLSVSEAVLNGNEEERKNLPESENSEFEEIDVPLPDHFFAIQLFSFVSAENANSAKQKSSFDLKLKNVHIIKMDHDEAYKVVIGPFDDKKSAEHFKKRNRLAGFVTDFILHD